MPTPEAARFAAVADHQEASRRRPSRPLPVERPAVSLVNLVRAAARDRQFLAISPGHCPFAANSRFRSVTFAAASSGGRSAFTMLSASASVPCRPTTSAKFARTRGSAAVAAVGPAQRLLRLGQIFRQHVGKPEIGQHRRLVGRDFQRARVILPRFLVPAELIECGALRREDAPVRIVGAMGAAKHVEGLLEIAVVGQRPPIAGQQRLVAGVRDAWPARAPPPPGPVARWRAAPWRIAAPHRHPWDWPRKRSWAIPTSRRGRRRDGSPRRCRRASP